MLSWLGYIFSAATAWSFSEVFTDVCIKETPAGAPLPMDAKGPIKYTNLTGRQASAVSAAALLACIGVLHIKSMETDPFDYTQPGYWLAVFAGLFGAASALLLYTAYESAPSTVIVPLIQLTALFTLVISYVTTIFSSAFAPGVIIHETRTMSGLEAVAYTMILGGGLMPAAQGNISQFFSLRFWKQPYVQHIMGSNLLLAAINQLLDVATGDAIGMPLSSLVLISSYTHVLVSVVAFTCIGQLRAEIAGLKHCFPSALVVCLVAEVLNWLAFYSSVAAYHAHEANISIVSAAEVSLSQLMNLATAVVLKLAFNYGRDSALTNVRSKVLSCVFVTLGVLLASCRDLDLTSLGSVTSGSSLDASNIDMVPMDNPAVDGSVAQLVMAS